MLMKIAADLIILVIAIFHFYFLILEMFLWTKPKGLKVFAQSLEEAKSSAKLAANQGLYNGFLASGLIWGLIHPNEAFKFQIKLFFLVCIVIAGIYGAKSVNRKIFFIQALPAIIAIAILYFSSI